MHSDMNWYAAAVRIAGLLFATFLVTRGWYFWPIVIAIICIDELRKA